MGMDSVQIVLTWEQSLHVTITDAEAGALSTPRMAIDLLCRKLDVDVDCAGTCLSQRVYYHFRRGLVTTGNAERGSVRRSTKLRNLIPSQEKSHRWATLRAASHLPELPDLTWCGALVWRSSDVEDVVRWTLANAAWTVKPPGGTWTRQEIRCVVREGIAEVTGIRDFEDDYDFVRDLGVD